VEEEWGQEGRGAEEQGAGDQRRGGDTARRCTRAEEQGRIGDTEKRGVKQERTERVPSDANGEAEIRRRGEAGGEGGT
jgi:hypothetical protein